MNNFGFISIVLYITASILLAMNLKNHDNHRDRQKAALMAFAIALLSHGWLIFSELDIFSGNMKLGFFNAISLTSWLILTIILITSFMKPVLNLSIIMMPIASFAIFLAIHYPSQYHLTNHSLSLELHISMSLVAYSLLIIAALQACLMAFQDNKIRSKRPSMILNTLPPLQVMEDLLIQIISLGFFILSLSLLSGAMFVENIFTQHLVHKAGLSVVAWLIFATLLYGRWRNGWRGQTLFGWTITGSVTLIVAYFGSKFVLELLLNRV